MATILLVEDSKENAQLIITALENRGYEVVWVNNGNTVVNAIYEVDPDLILIDLRLPGKDGWAVIREIRGNSKIAYIPIIAVAVEAKSNDRPRAFNAGCDEFMPKPFRISELRQLVKQYIS